MTGNDLSYPHNIFNIKKVIFYLASQIKNIKINCKQTLKSNNYVNDFS